MAQQVPIRGVFAANVVPLDAEGQIHEAELRRYVDWLIARGVHGLYPNGSTGEFTRFTADERRRIIEIVVDQVAGRVPVLAGAAEANVRETLKACEYYHQLGVRAVAIVAPYYYKLNQQSVLTYFSEIGANTPVDVTLYNIPAYASPIEVSTVQHLSEKYERIAAIKDSSSDLTHMMRMIQAVKPNRPDFSFLTGWDPLLMSSLLIGCDGGTHALSGILPEAMRELFELTTAGKLREARALQFQLLPLFDAAIYPVEFPEGVRAGLRLRGIQAGFGRQPLSEEQQQRVAEVTGEISALLKGFKLLEGQQSGAGEVSPTDAHQISRIVEEVLKELRGTRTA